MRLKFKKGDRIRRLYGNYWGIVQEACIRTFDGDIDTYTVLWKDDEVLQHTAQHIDMLYTLDMNFEDMWQKVLNER